jgi:uncharacterized protein
MADARLTVTVKPRAARVGVVRTPDGVLVRVSAPPADGAANTAVLAALADALHLPKSHLTLVTGASSRVKRVRIAGLAEAELAERVAALPGEAAQP